MGKKTATAMETDRDTFHTTLTRLRTEIDTGGPKVLHKGETFSFVGKATVNEWTLRTLKKKDTRVQVGTGSRAVIVDDELAEDVLAAHEEFTTGQMRLLSLEGEDRRAARVALGRLTQLREDKGFTPESDDAAFESPVAFLDQAARAHEEKLTSLFAGADGMGTVAYMEACEDELIQAAATILAGVTYCRRALGRHYENEARAKQIVTDETGTALTDAEVEEQRAKAAPAGKTTKKRAATTKKLAATITKVGKAKDGGLKPGEDGGL